jgi:hypothetical protein
MCQGKTDVSERVFGYVMAHYILIVGYQPH